VGVNLLQTTTKVAIPLQLYPKIRVLKNKEQTVNNSDSIIPQVYNLLLRLGFLKHATMNSPKLSGDQSHIRSSGICMRARACVCVQCVCVQCEVAVELYVLRPLSVRAGQSSCGLLALPQEDLPH